MKPIGQRGFTLIELLVVITIIVVLLALLTPALDKAIYAADLAVCGARLKAAASGAISYTFSNKKHYPDRGLSGQAPGQAAWLAPFTLVNPLVQFDMRANLKDYMSINKHLQCPLNTAVDLENIKVDESVASSYTMWWGWGYHTADSTTYNQSSNSVNSSKGSTYPGMYKLGDRFEWAGDRYNLLIDDFDLIYPTLSPPSVQGSHPDRDPNSMTALTAKYVGLYGGAAGVQALPVTVSIWVRMGSIERGLIDTNHAYDDASVRRLDGESGQQLSGAQADKRTERIPVWFDNRRPDTFQVPRP